MKRSGHISEVDLHTLDAGDVTGVNRNRIERHLATCETCQKRTEMVRHLRSQLSSLPVPQPDELAWKRIERGIKAKIAEAPTRRSHGIFRWVAVAAAILLVAGGGLHHYLKDEPSQLSPRPSVPRLIETGQEQFALDLPGGSRVVVAPSSRLRLLDAETRSMELHLESGGVECQVAQLGPEEAFSVITPGFRVTVHGTRFLVHWQDGEGDVAVSEGVVKVEGVGFSSVTLYGGQRFVFPSSSEESSSPVVDKEQPAQSSQTPNRVRVRREDEQPLRGKVSSRSSPAVSRSKQEEFPAKILTVAELLKEMDAMLANGNRTGTIEMAERFLDYSPTSIAESNFVRTLGELYRFSGESGKAEELYERASRNLSDGGETLFQLGRIRFYDLRYYSGAREAFEAYLASHPSGSRAEEASYLICEARMLAHEFAGAIEACQVFVDRYPRSSRTRGVHYIIGTLHREKFQDCRRAAEAYSRALLFSEFTEQNDEALFWRAWCRSEMDRREEALADLHFLVEHYPRYGRMEEVKSLIKRLEQ